MSTTTPPPGSGGPEYLEPDGGEPLEPSRDGGSGGRRTALVAGAAAVGLALVGGGVWAAMSFFATGAQPAEALPASTVGYAAIDLDPSGGQKIEAFRMIEKFPALKEELGGFDADDDLLEKLFANLEDECEGVSYADDLEPWLGQRFAVAAVDLGEDRPTPVGVAQVSDAAAAEDGLAELKECAGADVGGWAIEGEWAVVAETDDLAQQVLDAAAEGTLADDESFQKWTGEVGDAGVVNLYAAPAAGQFLVELLSQPMNPLGGPMGLFGGGMPPLEGEPGTDLDPPASPALPEEMTEALEGFQGMAATLRFDDGALEFEAVSEAGEDVLQPLAVNDQALESVGTLPADSAVALGLSLPEGWLDIMLEQVARMSGGEMTPEDMLTELEAQTGLTAEDVETLAGESAALALGSEFDLETFFGSSDGSDVPIGAKVKGDAGAIGEVLDKLAGSIGDDAGILGHDAAGDFVAIGPNGDYRDKLLEDGALGDSEVFRNVIREAEDAGAIMFVNFDAGDWLTSLAQGDQAAKENLEPLQGIGISSWQEGETSHGVLRLTTN